jgi:PAS domain S-box-containing protein
MKLILEKNDSIIYVLLLVFIVVGLWHLLTLGNQVFWTFLLTLLLLMFLIHSRHIISTNRKLQDEVKQQHSARAELTAKYNAEKALSDIFSIVISSNDTDSMIRKSLEMLGTLYNADIASFFKFEDCGELIKNVNEWRSINGASVNSTIGSWGTSHIEKRQFSWLISRLISKGLLIMPNIDELPLQASSEKAIISEMQVKSFVASPVMSNGELSGFLLLGNIPQGCIRENEYMNVLGVFSGLLGISYEKKQALESLRKNKKQLEYQLEFESLISEISTKFLSLRPDELDAGIDLALMRVGEFAGVDRSYVFQFSCEKSLMHNTHEWCAQGVNPEKGNLQNMPTADAPWLMENLISQRTVHISAVAKMTPEATENEKQILEAQGIKSLVIVPMVFDDDIIGYIGFDSVQEEKEWPNESIRLLNILAQMFVSALQGKAAVEELNIERAQLLSIFDSMDEAVYVADPSTYKILYVNRCLKEKLGTDPVGGVCYKVFQGLDMPCDFCTNPIILKNRNETCVWEHHNRFDGKHYIVTDRIIKWPGGSDVRLELARDITSVIEAENGARKSEEKFRKTVENSPMPVAILSHEGIFEYVNRRFTETFGYTKEDIPTIPDWLMHAYPEENYRKNRYHEWERLTCINDVDVSENSKVVCKDGTLRNIDFHLAKTSDEFIIVANDFTERKKVEDALLLEEARLEALQQLNQMTELSVDEIENFVLEEGIRLTGSKIGYIGFLSEDCRSLTMHTWSEDAMLQCNMEHTKTEFLLSEAGLWVEAIRECKPVIINDYQLPHPRKVGYPQGHILVERYMNVPIIDGNKVIGVAGVGNKADDYDQADVRQLTLLMHGMWRLIQRKNAENSMKDYASKLSEVNIELSKANEELKSLDELKNNFLANISHELKTPLIPILGFSELVADRSLGPLNSEQERAMNAVVQSSGQLKRLIESLIFMSTLEAKQFAYELNPVSLEPIIEKATSIISIENRDKKLELIMDMPCDLRIINGDTDYLSQLFMHLIDNAFKFTPSGGKISLSGYNHNDYVHIIIGDTGIGIPSNKVMKAFDSFYQIDGSRSRKYGGTGIGLSICKKIAEDHGGKLWIESEENVGTQVHITFPVLF